MTLDHATAKTTLWAMGFDVPWILPFPVEHLGRGAKYRRKVVECMGCGIDFTLHRASPVVFHDWECYINFRRTRGKVIRQTANVHKPYLEMKQVVLKRDMRGNIIGKEKEIPVKKLKQLDAWS